MTFNCTKCGECCKRVGDIPGFPEPIVPGTKTCSHLQPDNSCGIYETRPLVCRVDEVREVYFRDIPIKDWHEMNYEACRQLQGEK